MNFNLRRWISAPAIAALLASTTACTFLAPGLSPPGTSIDQLRQSGRMPTGEYELPGGGRRLHRAFFDPSWVTGTEQQRLAAFRSTRDEIAAWATELVGGL